MQYRFEVQQYLRFDVYDRDSASSTLTDHDFIGTVETRLGALLGRYAMCVYMHSKARGKDELLGRLDVAVSQCHCWAKGR